jgi:hypothetical protein
MQHLIFAFEHRIEDIIPYSEFVQKLRPLLHANKLGSYVGDDMAIDGRDAEAVFAGDDVQALFAFVAPRLKQLPFMRDATATLVLGALDCGAETWTVLLHNLDGMR